VPGLPSASLACPNLTWHFLSCPVCCRGYEASPFCKVVREKLSELELPHLYVSCVVFVTWAHGPWACGMGVWIVCIASGCACQESEIEMVAAVPCHGFTLACTCGK